MRKTLSAIERDVLLEVLKARFEKNSHRHQEIARSKAARCGNGS